MKEVRLTLNRYLDSHGITRYALSQAAGIKYPIIDNYYKNKVIRYDRDTLSRILEALDCGLTDILEVIDT